MLQYYVILRVDGNDRYVYAIEPTKAAKDALVALGYDWTHWDIQCCGDPPKIDDTIPWVDSRTYDIKRKSGFKMESDSIYSDYRGKVEDGDADANAKQEWKDKRREIKEKYLKPWIGCVADNTTDVFTANNHGFSNGQKIEFTGDVMPSGIVSGTVYYVINVAANTLQISTTEG